MKNVAVLTPWFPNRPGDATGGFIANSALAVTRAGWRVGVLVVRPWYPRFLPWLAHDIVRGKVCTAAFDLAALELVRVPSLPRLALRPVTDVVSDKMTSSAFERMARSLSANVIHAQSEGAVPIAAQVARRLGLPLVVTIHGINVHPRFLHSPYQKQRLQPALASANRVILVGEPLRDFFSSYIGSADNFEIVPNGIHLPELALNQPIFSSSRRKLISVSNLHEGKGIDLTLRALAQLASEGVADWTYQVVGAGYERDTLIDLAKSLGISEKVTFVGSVRNEEIYQHLLGNDIFVLPSYREAFGIAYLEAMAAGLLAIGVIGQGPSQFITHGVNGVLVPPRNVGSLVSILRDLIKGDVDHYRAIAREGQHAARNLYTWGNHAKQLASIYESVADETRVGSPCQN